MLLKLEIKGIKIIFIITLFLVLLNEYTSLKLMIHFGSDFTIMSKYLRCILYVYTAYAVLEYFLGLNRYENFLIAKVSASIVLVLVFLGLYYHYYLRHDYDSTGVALAILLATITIAQMISITIMRVKIKLISYNTIALLLYLIVAIVLLLFYYVPTNSIYDVYYYLY